jgi:SAM-dependent methyltransferase
MKDPTERFSDRVENYVKYRPGYPPEVLQLFRDEMGLTNDSVIADIGAGTGISTRMFLENGNRVIAIEPNDAMRTAADEFLGSFANYKSVKATAEKTTLAENSVDIAVAAQAFHWFDIDRTREEFRRILKHGGYIALIWNERELDTTPFLREYEQFLIKFADDYANVRHENVNNEKLRTFFGDDFQTATFGNKQVLDLDGLRGRVVSSSYMPTPDSKDFPAMNEDLASLFAKHAESDRIEVLYLTKIYYKQV